MEIVNQIELDFVNKLNTNSYNTIFQKNALRKSLEYPLDSLKTSLSRVSKMLERLLMLTPAKLLKVVVNSKLGLFS